LLAAGSLLHCAFAIPVANTKNISKSKDFVFIVFVLKER
jgi:hypothetical protein